MLNPPTIRRLIASQMTWWQGSFVEHKQHGNTMAISWQHHDKVRELHKLNTRTTHCSHNALWRKNIHFHFLISSIASTSLCENQEKPVDALCIHVCYEGICTKTRMIVLSCQILNESWHHLRTLFIAHWYTPHFIQLCPLMYVFRLLRRKGKVMQNCSCFGLKLFRYLISKQSTNKCSLCLVYQHLQATYWHFIWPGDKVHLPCHSTRGEETA